MGWPLPRSAQQRPGLWQSAEGWPLRELSAVSAGTFPAQLFLPDLKISGKLYPADTPAHREQSQRACYKVAARLLEAEERWFPGGSWGCRTSAGQSSSAEYSVPCCGHSVIFNPAIERLALRALLLPPLGRIVQNRGAISAKELSAELH